MITLSQIFQIMVLSMPLIRSIIFILIALSFVATVPILIRRLIQR